MRLASRRHSELFGLIVGLAALLMFKLVDFMVTLQTDRSPFAFGDHDPC
jgi:hypothetical protein